MIATWMLYLGLVGFLAYLGGRCAEPLAAAVGLGRRAVWVAALMAALLVPASAALRPAESAPPEPAATTLAATAVVTAEPSGSVGVPLAVQLAAFDRPLTVLWAGSILVFGLWLLIGALRALHARAMANLTAIDGIPIRRSPDFGPSVVGLLRPEIVVPEWISDLAPADRALLLAHEQAHIAGREPLLLAAADVAVTLMPWNPGLWLSRARLRRAIELDCDARVLARHADPARYGRLLLDVGDRLLNRGALPAFARPRSSLAERIDAITLRKPSMRPRTALALVTGFGLVVVAACSSPEPDPFAESPLGSRTGSIDRGTDLASFRLGLSRQAPAAGVLIAIFDRDGKAVAREHLEALGALGGSTTLGRLAPAAIGSLEVLKGKVPFDAVLVVTLKEPVPDVETWTRRLGAQSGTRMRKVAGASTDIVLTVDGEQITINDQPVLAADLDRQLRAIYVGRESRRLVVATTDRAETATVDRVVAAARDAGVLDLRRTAIRPKVRRVEPVRLPGR